MTESKGIPEADHTPGPWTIRDHTVGHPPRRSWIDIVAPTGVAGMEHPICRIPAGFTNQDADARLIASAPDLLANLRVAAESVCSLLCPSSWETGYEPPHSLECQSITRIIARITGEES